MYIHVNRTYNISYCICILTTWVKY